MDPLAVSANWFLIGDGQMWRSWEADPPMVMSESAGLAERAAGGSGLDSLCLLLSNSGSFFMALLLDIIFGPYSRIKWATGGYQESVSGC